MAATKVRWEYQSLSERQGESDEGFVDRLNALGAEGWEAFSAVQELVVDPTELLGQRHIYPHGITVFLKRQLSD